MPRPLRQPITSGTQNWNATVDDNFAALFDRPAPVPSVAGTSSTDIESAYPAASYAGCLCALDNAGTFTLYFSNGSAWGAV